ncbi:dTDP-glucose 4,6-dehydratase [Wukongibacter baidiensis]|uniref:dTDP-glucose 4,6-dehydratase n=1 Tax=Wukongibacter baidiensis TaxID=1723361 RepID=UPI003D7FF679
MKTYLITGGYGFIGSNFIRYLFDKYLDVQIINVDKLTYAGNLENLDDIHDISNYMFVKGDICDSDLLENIFKEYDIDYLINFAAESHVDRSIENSDVFIKTNVLGTQTLLDIAKKHWGKENSFIKGKKFIQISTDEVYGSLESHGYFTENTPLNPRNPYSASKASGDMLVRSYYHTYKMPVIITRCSNNYGPYQFPEKLIPLMVNNTLQGRNLPIYGDGKNIRDWLYVKEHCKAIDMIIEAGKIGQVYNIGGHNEKRNVDVVKTIIREVKNLLSDSDERSKHISEKLIEFVEDRKGHDRRYAIDTHKIEKEIGWKSEIKFEEGIRQTIKWYLDNIEWLESIISGEYKSVNKKI